MTKITKKTLMSYGFTPCEHPMLKNSPSGFYHVSKNQNVFIKKPGNKFWSQIIFIMGDYPEGNPNCGICQIYDPPSEAMGIPSDLYEKEDWTAEDHIRATNFRIPLPARCIPVAWGINNMKRLIKLYEGLTGEKLEKVTPDRVNG